MQANLMYAGFIDAGFLRAEGAKALGQSPKAIRPDALAVMRWFRCLGLPKRELGGHSFLRAYWYDSSFDPSHSGYSGQRSFFDAIAMTPGLQLRLGHIVESPSPLEQPILRAIETTADELPGVSAEAFMEAFHTHWRFRPVRQQKGVDTLIALDMVRLAGRAVCSTMILVAGDRDFAEVIRASQDFGVRVLIATPRRHSVSREVAQLADDLLEIDAEDLPTMLTPRPAN